MTAMRSFGPHLGVSVVLGLIWGNTAAAAGPLFPGAQYQAGDIPHSIAIDDLDGDGDADLAVASAGEPTAPLGPLEQPDDEPAERVLPPGVPPIQPPATVVRGRFQSVQVNVDANGFNIVGDAANEPSIAVDPTDPSRLAIGWRQFDTVASNFRQAGWAYSHDGGQTWTFPGVLDPGQFRSDPILDADVAGNFYYYSLSGAYEGWECELFKSFDGGVTWPQMASAFGGDKPWMVVDRTAGIGEGNIYVIWQRYYNCCGDRTFTRSTDGGLTFEEPIHIPDNPTFGTLAVGPSGEVYAAGIHNQHLYDFVVARSTNAQDPAATPTFVTTNVDIGGSMSFGAGPNPDGLLGQVWVAVDHSAGPTRGNVYVLCSVDPVGDDPLDVMFIRSTDGGVSWSTPVRINDDPVDNRAWQWFGTMAVAPSGRIDVIWNDTRDHPAAHFSQLYYCFSVDGGLTWTANIAASPSFNHSQGYPQNDKLGDYYDMISDQSGAHVAYAATFNNEQDVYYLRIPFDCNSNGTLDSDDILGGTSDDCNLNGIPDECEFGSTVDCNSNGILDLCEPGGVIDCNANAVTDWCDLAGGTSNDCNTNGIPDECDDDCNNNLLADECDLAAGTSLDCNSNGIPDECDIESGAEPDCNTNGVPDPCDIAGGTSPDCQPNGVPDKCDIESGTDGDCNTNGVPDSCDIVGGTSPDCQTNAVPDECEPGWDLDCNDNTVADFCDIWNGTSQDCQSNTIPDECEPGWEVDCNTNGVADFCDLANGTSTDYNGNAIPDECEPNRSFSVDDDAPADPLPGDPTSSDPDEDGSPAHPFDAVQEAIDAAIPGDEIVLADGVYTGPGNKYLDYGGRGIVVRGANGPENCVIDCEGDGRAFDFCSGEGRDAVLQGLTVRNANAGYGAVYCRDSSGPTIVHTLFVDNSAGGGGGLACYASSPLLLDCTFRGNSATEGGGAYVGSGQPVFVNCTFEDNHAIESGGGLANYGRSKIFNSLFVGNGARYGGGVSDFSNRTVLANCTFSYNRGGAYGGGLLCYESNNLLLVNCTFSDNRSPNGGGLYLQSTRNLTLTGCVLWGNRWIGAPDESDQINVYDTPPVVSYCCVQGLDTFSGNGNIGDDPLFVDSDGPDDIPGTEDDDLRLRPGSLCIDAGDNTAVPPDKADLDDDGDTSERTPLDLDGSPRFVDDPKTGDTGVADPPYYTQIVDMGAYEFFPDCNSNGVADACDIDCDTNGGPCDVPGCGQSEDCNTNRIPDECDIAAGTSEDVNTDGIPDECNHPPVCDADGPYLKECEGAVTTVGLDGTGSSDPDGDPLTYSWTTDCPGGSFDDPSGPTPILTLTSGGSCLISCTVTLVVTDTYGAVSTCGSTVTVVDNTPPTVTCPENLIVECDGSGNQAEYAAWMTGFSATDACNQIIDVSNVSLLPRCGSTFLSVYNEEAYDVCYNRNECSATFEVEDNTPPEITCPPNVTVTCGDPTDPDATGWATATDVCDDDPAYPAISYGDVETPTTCPADPVMYTITRTWTAADECGNSSECVQTITVLRLVHSGLIIKQDACPAPLNRSSHGVLPVVLTGDLDFDVYDVDLATVRLSRADCVGGSVAPNDGPPGPKIEFEDLNHPYVGEGPCSCNENQQSDGIVDLSMKFRTDDLVEALELDSFSPGALVELVLSGTLADGCEFTATDCVRLVAPGTPPALVTILANVADVWIDVDPLDDALDGGGFTDFERSLPLGTVVTLTAQATANGQQFRAWRINGVMRPSGQTTVQVTVTDDVTAKAVYRVVSDAPAPNRLPTGSSTGDDSADNDDGPLMGDL